MTSIFTPLIVDAPAQMKRGGKRCRWQVSPAYNSSGVRRCERVKLSVEVRAIILHPPVLSLVQQPFVDRQRVAHRGASVVSTLEGLHACHATRDAIT